MSTWSPGDGGPDLLSTGDEQPRWTDRFRTTAVAALCLVAGGFLGVRLDDAGSPLSAPSGTPPAVVTGGVVSSLVDPEVPLPHQFQVSLFNPGERGVRVRVAGLTGLGTAVTAPAVDITPHGWAQARFSRPAVCEEPTLPAVTAVRIRFVDPEVAHEQQVQLAGPAVAIRDDHRIECRAPTRLARGQLTGLWFAEEIRGRWADLAGKTLVRFTSDGRFALDPEGHLFDEGGQGFFGSYRLTGSRLLLRAEGGYACEVGYTEVWTTTLLAEDRLRLDIDRSDGGYCNSPPGERHILRRLVPEVSLPLHSPAVAAVPGGCSVVLRGAVPGATASGGMVPSGPTPPRRRPWPASRC